MTKEKQEALVHALKDWDETRLNGCVIIHMDKETKKVQSISPLVPAESIDELYYQLSCTRDAIQSFLNELIDKKLIKDGRAS